MKQLVCEFILYFYINFIREDWDDINKIGKIIIYPLWLIRSIILTLIFPIFLIPFFIERSNFYEKFKETKNLILKTY